jgi:hypothetical protein
MRVVGPWPVDVGAGEQDDLLEPELLRVLHQLLKPRDVPGMVFLAAALGIVHHAQVHQCREPPLPKHFFHALPAQIDFVMFDVLGSARKDSSIEGDDLATSMQAAHETPTQIAASARDHHALEVSFSDRCARGGDRIDFATHALTLSWLCLERQAPMALALARQ